MAKNRIVKRVGLNGFPGWKGVNRQGDPASIGQDQFWSLTNVRWKDGALVARGGQEKLLAGALNPALVTGIYDSSSPSCLSGGVAGGGLGSTTVTTGGGGGGATGVEGDGPKLYWHVDNTNRYVMFFDEEKTGAPYSNNVFESNANGVLPVAGATLDFTHSGAVGIQWNGELWYGCVGTGAGGWGLISIAPAYGATFPLPRVRAFVPAASSNDQPKVPCVWRGKLYFCLARSSGVSAIIYEYDGTTLRIMDSPGVPTGVAQYPLIGYQDLLYAAGNLAPDNLIRLITIAGGGSNAIMPSTRFQVGSSIGAAAWAEYKGTLYVAGTDGNADPTTSQRGVIYSTTSTTFAVARDLGTGAGALVNPVRCLAVFNGYLYYLWDTAAAPTVRILGRFDGTTWTNSHFSFTAGEGPFAQMFPYKGDLLVVSQGTTNVPVWRSAGTDTTSFTAMQADSTTNQERMRELTPFV